MEWVGFAVIASMFRRARGTILPDGVLDDFGIESLSMIVRRRGVFSKKLRSRVTKSCPGRQDLRMKVVRFARFFQGRSVMTPLSPSLRKDERSLLRSVQLRTGAAFDGSSVQMIRDLIWQICGVTRKSALSR